MLDDILRHDHIQWHPQLVRYNTNLWTYYRTWPYCRFWPNYQMSECFHGTLQRVWLANRGRLLLRTPGSIPFWTCVCSNVEILNLSYLRTFWVSSIPRYFYFAYQSFLKSDGSRVSYGLRSKGTGVNWMAAYKRALIVLYLIVVCPDPHPIGLFVGFPQPLDLSSLTVYAEHSLLLRMSLDIWHINSSDRF